MCKMLVTLMLAVHAAGATAALDAFWVSPQDTDPAIDAWLEPHYVAVNPAVRPRERLFVFIPGSYAIPSQYQMVVQAAANEGYLAIGLRYPNSWSVNFDVCGLSPNPDCHAQVREETLTGAAVSEDIFVTPANSIENRLAALLAYLEALRPGEGWGGFAERGAPAWGRVVVAGHSQGGGHVGFIAKRYDVSRGIMFAGGTDLFLGEGCCAGWLYGPQATAASKLFGFLHLQDSAPAYFAAWEALGLAALGPPRGVDNAAPPYGFAHELFTNRSFPPGAPPETFHNAIIVDAYLPLDAEDVPVYLPVWRYLLNVTTPLGNVDADWDVDLGDVGRLQAAFGRCSGDADFDVVSDLAFSGCVDVSDAMLLLGAVDGPR